MSNKRLIQLLLFFLGCFFTFLLARFPFPGNLLGISFLFIVLGGYYFAYSYYKNKSEKEFASSFNGQIYLKRKDCLAKITALRKELKSIDTNIADLNSKLRSNPKASQVAKEETAKLITGFQEEKKLRQSKINFYELCQTKFNQIIKNHQLTEELKLKREKLEALKEKNIDEVSDMEGMKTFIDYEKTYIETIDELSLQMLQSRSLERAEALQLELVEMTKELREL